MRTHNFKLLVLFWAFNSCIY